MNEQQKNPKVSVVVPILNGGNDLLRLLDRLASQSLASDMEIILVDSGSRDDSLHYARQRQCNIIEIPARAFNHGATRNLGASKAHGEFLFFFTQDALPQRNDYCETMIDSLEANQADAGYARQIPRPEAGPLVRRDVSAWLSGVDERRVVRAGRLDDFCGMTPYDRYARCVFDNVASVIRRAAWKAIPFPHAPYGEDIEWGLRALSNGMTLVYEPDAAVIHSHDRPPDYTWKRTLIDHYRLNELFGLRTVPTRRAAIRGWMSTTRRDWGYLLSHPPYDSTWRRDFINAPRHAWAAAWGQFHGARMAARGEMMRGLRGV
ncbi:MAG: glycosyltransferase [bacterium]|nr:glycosyltransferase [bacterium]